MLATTRTFLDLNTDVWSGVPIIATVKTELDSVIQEIIHHQEAQEASQVFLGSNKLALKKAVAEKADILNDILASYAEIEDNAALLEKSNKSFSDFNRLPYQDFQTVVKETIQLLDDNLASLADYGVSEDQVTDLKNSFDDFMSISGEPRLYKVASVQATKALEDLFTQASDLLKSKLDRLMKRYKTANTNFYNGYVASRVLVN
ncbi:MAG: hypothetical protein NXI20_02100 [bacterium]|nr:hypothetical protein [bacterium]